jgi:hypothetical protein
MVEMTEIGGARELLLCEFPLKVELYMYLLLRCEQDLYTIFVFAI